MKCFDAAKLAGTQLDWQSLFAKLKDSSWQISIVVTGGGTGVIGKCFARSGASCNFVDAVVPYSRLAVRELVGRPLQFPSVSEEMATELAAAAFGRAQRLSDRPSSREAGIALTAALPTAALPTEPPRHVVDRIYVATKTAATERMSMVELPEGAFTRESAEQVAEALFYEALIHLTQKG